MRKALIAAPLALIATAPAAEQPSSIQLKATVTALVAFGTRHSLSNPDDPKRGIGAARAWAKARFDAIGAACGGCLTSETIARTFTGPRAPNGVNIVDVLGVQKGTDPDRVVIVGGHVDSIVGDVMDSKADAPGANDDASGVAVVLEAARILSKRKFGATIVYAVFSGEEQGLWGGKLLADTAKARGWTVTAMLNNDIIGNSVGQGGVVANKSVRIFSEGIRESEDMKGDLARRMNGGEDDGPSRALAKTIDQVAAGIPGGAPTGSDAAAITCPSSNSAIRRCALPSRPSAGTGSTNMSAPKRASPMATRSTRWTSPIWPRWRRSTLRRSADWPQRLPRRTG
jgi:hypothetical protein